jgi:MATE family multidrug resistance protein
VLWTNVEPLALLLHQTPHVARLTQSYMRLLLVGTPAFFAFEALRRFLQVQRVVSPMLHATLFADVIHPGLCWLLSRTAGLGVAGIALATSLSYSLMLCYLLAVVLLRRPHQRDTWGGWTWHAFRELKPYLRLAIPGA